MCRRRSSSNSWHWRPPIIGACPRCSVAGWLRHHRGRRSAAGDDAWILVPDQPGDAGPTPAWSASRQLCRTKKRRKAMTQTIVKNSKSGTVEYSPVDLIALRAWQVGGLDAAWQAIRGVRRELRAPDGTEALRCNGTTRRSYRSPLAECVSWDCGAAEGEWGAYCVQWPRTVRSLAAGGAAKEALQDAFSRHHARAMSLGLLA
jgi:hypothetical protein